MKRFASIQRVSRDTWVGREAIISPTGSWAYKVRGQAHGELGDFERAAADLSEALRLTPTDAWTWELRAKAYLELGRYDEALADWERVAVMERDKVARTVLIRAQMLLMSDRTEEYRQTCVEMLDRFGRSDDPGEVYLAARACVLAPNAISDPMRAVELAKQAHSSHPAPWRLHALGMAHFRAGQLEEAAQRFDESLKAGADWDARFLNWLGLALVHHRRGETEEARQWLGKAVDLMEQHPAPAQQDRIEGQLLRREVEQLLEKPEQETQDAQSKKEE